MDRRYDRTGPQWRGRREDDRWEYREAPDREWRVLSSIEETAIRAKEEQDYLDAKRTVRTATSTSAARRVPQGGDA